MSKYFTKCTFGVQAKNKSQQEIVKLTDKYDCLLLNSEDTVSKMVGEIRELVEIINKKNKHCRDIAVESYYHPKKDEDIMVTYQINIGYLLYIFIYPVKNYYK